MTVTTLKTSRATRIRQETSRLGLRGVETREPGQPTGWTFYDRDELLGSSWHPLDWLQGYDRGRHRRRRKMVDPK